MPKNQPKRNKKEILADISAVSESNRKRQIVKEKIFPFVKDFKSDIRYAKIFLHTTSVAVDSVFDRKKTEITIKDIKEDILKLFKAENEEQKDAVKAYHDILDLLEDESVASFQSMIRELPENLDRLSYHESERKPFSDVDVDKLLG